MPIKKRITHIQLENFRAFYGKNNIITLPRGESLLVYGENGSGKSSLYRALRNFFESTDSDSSIVFESNIFASDEADVKITFSDFEDDKNGKRIIGTDQIFGKDELSNLNGETQFIYESNLSKGFFSYREMLATHFVDEYNGEINFFNLLIEKILKNYKDAGTGRTLYDEWEELDKTPNKFKELRMRLSASPFVESVDNSDDFVDFNKRLEANLDLLAIDTNQLYQKFDPEVTVEFNVEEKAVIDHSKSTGFSSPTITLKVKYFGMELTEHHNFLNEARLSALALSIYLASILNIPIGDSEKATDETEQIEIPVIKEENIEGVEKGVNHAVTEAQTVYRILFLDDVFLGLDTGNRQPLLDILNERFQGYQIFMTTYDKEWFEIARNNLSGNWKAVEMYIEEQRQELDEEGIWNDLLPNEDFTEGLTDSQKRLFEKPLIIDPSLDYFEKAKLYFQKKDYPTCANFQRKWCENFLKKYLQENYRLEIADNETALAVTKLDVLFQKLQKFYKDCGKTLPIAIEKEFKLHKEIVMNPFSHDDLKSPIYKREIERGFKIIEEFKNIPKLSKKKIEAKGNWIYFKIKEYQYLLVCELKSDLILIKHGDSIDYLGFTVDVVAYKEGEKKWVNEFQKPKNKTIKEISNMVYSHFLKIEIPEDFNEFAVFRLASNGERLDELMAIV